MIVVSQVIKIVNPMGLQVHPAGNLCKEADRFKCKVMFKHQGNETNAKSMLSVLGACIKFGDEITLICDGEGEEEALAHMVAYIEAGLED